MDVLPEPTLTAINTLEQEQASEPNHVLSFKFFSVLRFRIVHFYLIQNYSYHRQVIFLKSTLQVCLHTADLLVVNGVTKRNISKSMRKLFTKDGTLKVNLGSAHKGWKLVCKKKTKLKSSTEAAAEAMDHIASMIKNNAVGTDKGVKFWFARRTLGLAFLCLFFQSNTAKV